MRLRVKDVVLLSGHKEEKSEQNHPPPFLLRNTCLCRLLYPLW